MIHFRMIGDVHGELKEYVRLASEAQYTVQVGDLGSIVLVWTNTLIRRGIA